MRALEIGPSIGFTDILRRAIADEQESHAFYLHAAALARTARERELFLDLAADELVHRRKLEDILADWETRDALNDALGG